MGFVWSCPGKAKGIMRGIGFIVISICLLVTHATHGHAQSGKSDKSDINAATVSKSDGKSNAAKVAKISAGGPNIVYDPSTGNVLSHKYAGEPWYPASLTKLLTAYIIFEDIRKGKYTLKDKLVVSNYANSLPPSKLGAPAGSKLPIGFSLKVLLVRSTNDIAVALAEHSAGSVANFARRMNATAARLDMTGSYFANPHGLPDPRQVTTARDMALLGAAIMRDFPEHAGYFSAPNVAIGKKKYRNRNRLLREWKAANGMKTGYICNSGFNLVASATVSGRQLIAVVLGSKGGVVRAKKAKELLEAGFATLTAPGASTTIAPMSSVVNQARPGTAQPKDMAPTLCKGRPPFKEVAPAIMKDAWGIALGRFAKGSQAHAVVQNRLLTSHELFVGGKGAVIRMPDKSGYLGVIGRLEKPQTTRICAEMVKLNDTCQILSPEVFADLDAQDKVVRAKERKRRKKQRAKKRARKKAARQKKRKKK